MTRPMTTEELFEKINGILKEKGKLPDILDYGLATSNPIPIRTYEFDLGNSLNYGGNEGIYLELWIKYRVENEECRASVGTYKTLYEDDNAMHIMASLLAISLLRNFPTESALKKKDELLKYHKKVVRDNATRKEKIYESKI